MPLVDPVTMSQKGGDKTSDWVSKLVGKKIGDKSNETTFAKTDLPKEHRVVPHGHSLTMDFKPDRLNVNLAEDGTVKDVRYG